MFCSKCGKEVHDDAVVCTSCGCSIGKKEQVFDESVGEDKASGGLIAVSILIPIVGVILGIVNLCKSKKKVRNNISCCRYYCMGGLCGSAFYNIIIDSSEDTFIIGKRIYKVQYELLGLYNI